MPKNNIFKKNNKDTSKNQSNEEQKDKMIEHKVKIKSEEPQKEKMKRIFQDLNKGFSKLNKDKLPDKELNSPQEIFKVEPINTEPSQEEIEEPIMKTQLLPEDKLENEIVLNEAKETVRQTEDKQRTNKNELSVENLIENDTVKEEIPIKEDIDNIEFHEEEIDKTHDLLNEDNNKEKSNTVILNHLPLFKEHIVSSINDEIINININDNKVIVEKPQEEQPDGAQGEVNVPEIEQHEANDDEIKESEIDQPDIKQNELEQPEIQQPEIEELEVNGIKIESSEVNEPEENQPEEAQDKKEQPEIEQFKQDLTKEDKLEEELIKEEQIEVKYPEVEQSKEEFVKIFQPQENQTEVKSLQPEQLEVFKFEPILNNSNEVEQTKEESPKIEQLQKESPKEDVPQIEQSKLDPFQVNQFEVEPFIVDQSDKKISEIEHHKENNFLKKIDQVKIDSIKAIENQVQPSDELIPSNVSNEPIKEHINKPNRKGKELKEKLKEETMITTAQEPIINSVKPSNSSKNKVLINDENQSIVPSCINVTQKDPVITNIREMNQSVPNLHLTENERKCVCINCIIY